MIKSGGGGTSSAVTPGEGTMPSCRLSKLSIWLEVIVPHTELVGAISTLEPFKSVETDPNGPNVSLGRSSWPRGKKPAGVGGMVWLVLRVRVEG